MSKRPRRMADLMVGTWSRTLAAAVVIIGVAAVALTVAATAGDLRHASFPGHPYPPAGYYRNPFSQDPDNLLSAAEAARVRADFEEDGRIEVDAFARGDAAALNRADSGGRLSTLRLIIDRNNQDGIVELYDNHVERVVVGRMTLSDGVTVTWFVREFGTAVLTILSKAEGRTVRTDRYRFDARFWLARAGDHYLIRDAAITNTPLKG